MTDQAVTELAPRIGVRPACDAAGASQAGYYRRYRSARRRSRTATGPSPAH